MKYVFTLKNSKVLTLMKEEKLLCSLLTAVKTEWCGEQGTHPSRTFSMNVHTVNILGCKVHCWREKEDGRNREESNMVGDKSVGCPYIISRAPSPLMAARSTPV